jgi:hypothetical protein
MEIISYMKVKKNIFENFVPLYERRGTTKWWRIFIPEMEKSP